MRTILVVIVAFVLLVGLGTGSYSYIHMSAQKLSGHLETVENFIQQGKWDQARKELGQVQVAWEDTKHWWTVLLNHDEIDNIDISMKRLAKYVETRGVTFSLGELSALKLLVDHVADTESLNLENIL